MNTGEIVTRIPRFDKNTVTLNVAITITREFKARLWLGTKLIRLAALVMNVGVNVHVEKKEGEQI